MPRFGISAQPVEVSFGRKELVFMDAAVSGAQTIANSIQPRMEVVRIEAGGGGMAQIAAAP